MRDVFLDDWVLQSWWGFFGFYAAIHFVTYNVYEFYISNKNNMEKG